MFPPKVLHSNGGSQKHNKHNEKVCQTSLRGMYFGSCALTILKKVVGRATLRGDI